MPSPNQITGETKLEQFSLCFKNESDLRLALIGLLEKLPNTWDVKHTHGAGERGKDIVFRSNGPFASEDLVACIVKNTPITGSVDSDDGARTVYHQAEQSLDTPLLNAQGKEEHATRAFIITPYECSQSALDSIKGKLARPDGVVRFLCGRGLYELFEQYYPDYLVFRSGLFGTYIADLEAGISKDSAVSNLLVKHGLSGNKIDISKIYVQPRLYVNITEFHLMTEWPQLPRHLQRLTKDEVLGLAYRYVAFGDLIRALADEKEAEKLSGHVKWLANSVRELWNKAYEQHKKGTDPLYRSEEGERRRIALSLPGITELSGMFESRAVRTKVVFNEFLRTLDKANELAARHPTTLLEFVRDPARKEYSLVKSLAAQFPNMFEESIVVATELRATSEEVIQSGEDVLIAAPAGFGKTSFCRWNVLNDLRALKEEASNVVPVLVPLHQLALDAIATPQDLIVPSTGLTEMWAKRRSSDGKNVIRRFRLYLDGLDEVPDVNKQQLLLRSVQALKELEPTVHVILTGREHVSGGHLNTLSRLRVTEMNDVQVNDLLDQWFADCIERKAAFKQQLDLVPSLNHVMRVPLLATLILSVYETTSTLPESRIRLYDMFIALMAGGWDAAKRVHRDTQFGSQPKCTVLQYLAGRMHLNESRGATASQFNNAVKTLLPALETRSAALLEEIVHDGLLMPIGNSYEFPHLSFQEYLAAKDMIEPKGTKASEALGRYLRGNGWWKEVLSFYVALSGQPKEMETFIRAEAQKVAKKISDRQILQRTLGLLKEIAIAYPGSRPNMEFPQWPKALGSRS